MHVFTSFLKSRLYPVDEIIIGFFNFLISEDAFKFASLYVTYTDVKSVVRVRAYPKEIP